MKNDLATKMGTLIAKCWTDEEFKQRFIREPKVVIAEVLLDIPSDAELVVLEDTRRKRHFVLPMAPPDGFSTDDIGDAVRRSMSLGVGANVGTRGGDSATTSREAEIAVESLEPYCFSRASAELEVSTPYCRSDLGAGEGPQKE